jgi:hypothetical protein
MIVGDDKTPIQDLRAFQYSSWVIANLSLESFPVSGPGAPLSWDNVIYDSPSLGYVVATHQSLATHLPKTVLTFYHTLVDGPADQERGRLMSTPWEDWADFILKDLSKPHPEIKKIISRMDMYCWGHAMIQPRVGLIWGEARRRAAIPQGRIHFAHSDLSGFSLFEEAQYRGVLAAEKILTKHGVPFTSSL